MPGFHRLWYRLRMTRRVFAALALAALAPPVAAQKPRPPAPTGPERFEKEIRAYEDADRKNPPPPGGIVFVGSSSIGMWKSLDADFPGLGVLNRGFGGSSLAEATHYVGRIVVPYRPRQVVLYAGDNDLAAGVSPRQILLDFDAFVQRVRRDLPGVPIVFLAIKPSPSRARLLDAARDTNARIRAYAELHEQIVTVDLFTPMLGPDGKPRPELFVADKLHLNADGYALWKGIVAPFLRPRP